MRKNQFIHISLCLLLTVLVFVFSSCTTIKFFSNQMYQDFDDSQLVDDIRENFPEEYGYGEKVKIKSFDSILLDTSIYRVEGSHKYLVETYGLGGSKEFIFPIGSYFIQKGYNYVCYDLRCHGKSGGGLVLGLGLLDAKDMLCVLDYVIEMDPLAQIVVAGQSASGLGALIASSDMPDNVKCMVVDSGFVNFRDAAENFTHHAVPLLLDICDIGINMVYGKSLSEIDATKSISESKIPVFYILGGQDVFIAPSEAERIENLMAPGVPFKSLYNEQAPHTRILECEYENYVTSIFNFCDSFIQ